MIHASWPHDLKSYELKLRIAQGQRRLGKRDGWSIARCLKNASVYQESQRSSMLGTFQRRAQH